MSEPNSVAMKEMDLLAKSRTIETLVIGISDQKRRKDIMTAFKERYKDVPDMCSVMWSTDDNLKKVSSRCNGNLVLLAIGATAPQVGSHDAFDIDPIYVLPREALGVWTEKHLKVTFDQFNGHDRILLAEPAKYVLSRYFDHVPKQVHETKDAEIAKFLNEFKTNYPRLTADHVTVRYVLMRCNFGLSHRSDTEDHVMWTHGCDINSLEIMPTIKVNDGKVLVLTQALTIKEMSFESRNGVYNSWFTACVATGTVTMIENKLNAKIIKHKAEGLLKALKVAVGTDFYQKIFYNLQNTVKEGHDINLGFTGKWTLITDACEAALAYSHVISTTYQNRYMKLKMLKLQNF